MTAELSAAQWEPIRDAVRDFATHVVEAILHKSSSKADISESSALAALQKVRRIIEAELLAGRQDDVKRLDWLDAQSNDACLEFGFEMDGGVYLRIDSPGCVSKDIREMNSARAAIDFAITITS